MITNQNPPPPPPTIKVIYVSVNSKSAHPLGKLLRAFNFFERFWSNSTLCWQFTQSNAQPVRALHRDKFPFPLDISRYYSNINDNFPTFHISDLFIQPFIQIVEVFFDLMVILNITIAKGNQNAKV